MDFEHFGFKFSSIISPEDLATVVSSYKNLPELDKISKRYSDSGKVMIPDEKLISKYGEDKTPLGIHYFDTKNYQKSRVSNLNHPDKLLVMQVGQILADYYLRVRRYPYVEWWSVHHTGKIIDEDDASQPCTTNLGILRAAKIGGEISESTVMNFRKWEIQETINIEDDYSISTFRVNRDVYLAAYPIKPAILLWIGE